MADYFWCSLKKALPKTTEDVADAVVMGRDRACPGDKDDKAPCCTHSDSPEEDRKIAQCPPGAQKRCKLYRATVQIEEVKRKK